MAFDLNEAQPQKMFGPVPEGSSVKVRLDLVPAKNPHPKDDRIHVSAKSGLLMLSCRFTVVAGTYEGYSWRELWTMPVGSQPKEVEMTQGRMKSCTINHQKIRAIVEAAKGVNPNDNSAAARAARDIGSITKIDGMEFPATVKIDAGHEYNNRMYYNNEISYIVTPDRQKYKELMAGGEFINENGRTGNENQPAQQSNSYNDNAGFDDGSFAPVPSELEDAPF